MGGLGLHVAVGILIRLGRRGLHGLNNTAGQLDLYLWTAGPVCRH
jgi:hypothetical protein